MNQVMFQTVKAALTEARETPWSEDNHGYKIKRLSNDLVEVKWVYNVSGGGLVGPDTYYDLQRRRLTQLGAVLEQAGCAVLLVNSDIDGRANALIAHPANFEAAAAGVVESLQAELTVARAAAERVIGSRVGWPQHTASENPVLEAAWLYESLAAAEQVLNTAKVRHPAA